MGFWLYVPLEDNSRYLHSFWKLGLAMVSMGLSLNPQLYILWYQSCDFKTRKCKNKKCKEKEQVATGIMDYKQHLFHTGIIHPVMVPDKYNLESKNMTKVSKSSISKWLSHGLCLFIEEITVE